MNTVSSTNALGGRAPDPGWPNPLKYPYSSVRYWMARKFPPGPSLRKWPRTRKSCGDCSLHALEDAEARVEAAASPVSSVADAKGSGTFVVVSRPLGAASWGPG